MKHSAGRKEARKKIHDARRKDSVEKQQENDRKYRSLSGKKLYSR